MEPTPGGRSDPRPGEGDRRFVDAIGEGITNALALFGSPAPLSIPTPVTADREAAVEQLASGPASIVETVAAPTPVSMSPNLRAALRVTAAATARSRPGCSTID